MTKTRRLIELMTAVYEKRRFTTEEMAREFGVSYRTMLRYLQELSGMGVPLYAEPGKHGGYSLLTGNKPAAPPASALPPIRMLFKPATFVIGVEYQGPFTSVFMADAIVPQLWKALEARLPELGLDGGARRVGAVMGRGAVYRYVAGIEAPPSASVPDRMVALSLPARPYAAYVHAGEYERDERDQTYFQALEELKRLKREPDPHAWVLEYPRQPASSSAPREWDVYVPLRLQ